MTTKKKIECAWFMMAGIFVFDRHDHIMEPDNAPVGETEPQSSAAAAADSDSDPEDEPWHWSLTLKGGS